ncbi:MAG: glycerophosphodiester phosphodiesterase [Spirochaetales bacterium]|nr:glycerophosphodiester phosphodiesterase [Spirochaetales bacterium]
MTRIIAHRGASGYAPENTMAAFEKAAEQGAHGIETDVHLTKDGKLVLTHDPLLGRTIPAEGALKDYTLEELRRFDCGSWYSPEFAGEKVPLLADLMALVKEKDMTLNIEIKAGSPYYPGLEEALAEELGRWNEDDRLIVSSFNHYSLLLMEKLRPSLARGFLTGSFLIDSWEYVKKHRGQALHPHFHCVTPDMVKSCHKEGIAVNPYTVNDQADGQKLILAGVDNLITNYPDRMLELL